VSMDVESVETVLEHPVVATSVSQGAVTVVSMDVESVETVLEHPVVATSVSQGAVTVVSMDVESVETVLEQPVVATSDPQGSVAVSGEVEEPSLNLSTDSTGSTSFEISSTAWGDVSIPFDSSHSGLFSFVIPTVEIHFLGSDARILESHAPNPLGIQLRTPDHLIHAVRFVYQQNASPLSYTINLIAREEDSLDVSSDFSEDEAQVFSRISGGEGSGKFQDPGLPPVSEDEEDDTPGFQDPGLVTVSGTDEGEGALVTTEAIQCHDLGLPPVSDEGEDAETMNPGGFLAGAASGNPITDPGLVEVSDNEEEAVGDEAPFKQVASIVDQNSLGENGPGLVAVSDEEDGLHAEQGEAQPTPGGRLEFADPGVASVSEEGPGEDDKDIPVLSSSEDTSDRFIDPGIPNVSSEEENESLTTLLEDDKRKYVPLPHLTEVPVRIIPNTFRFFSHSDQNQDLLFLHVERLNTLQEHSLSVATERENHRRDCHVAIPAPDGLHQISAVFFKHRVTSRPADGYVTEDSCAKEVEPFSPIRQQYSPTPVMIN
jgi:hypothetical protein